jgi:hypothetical protein
MSALGKFLPGMLRARRKRGYPGNAPAGPAERSAHVHTGLEEWSITTTDYTGDPYDVHAIATFTHTDTGTYQVPLYYAGSNTFKYRFTGPRVGVYQIATSSVHPGLDGHTSSIEVTANPDPDAVGFLVGGNDSYRVRVGDGTVFKRVRPNTYQRHGDATNPGGWEQIAEIPNTNPTVRGDYIEAVLQEAQDAGFSSVYIVGGHNWVQYPRAYNQSSTNTVPDPVAYDIVEDLLQRAQTRKMFVELALWNDSQAGTSSGTLVGGINGTTDQRVNRMLMGRLGAYPNFTVGYGYDLLEWLTPAQGHAWHDFVTGLNTLPRLYALREDTGFTLGSDKLEIFSNDNRPTSGFYADARAQFNLGHNRPISYNRRFLHTRDAVWDMTTTRRAIWQFGMAGGASGVYGILWGPSANYPNPEQLKHVSDFLDPRWDQIPVVNATPTDGMVLQNADATLQVVYKENVSSIQITIPAGQTNVPVVAVNATAATYAEISQGTYNAGTHTVTLGSTSDWALAVGNF